MKTSELTGAALDWAVAEADGTPIYRSGKTLTRMDMDGGIYWQPSTDWAQGGPIIEREKITLIYWQRERTWEAACPVNASAICAHIKDANPLIAAMRSYVASRFGVEVEIPEELK